MESNAAAERRGGGPTEYRAIHICAGRAGEGIRAGTGAEGVRRHVGAGAARHGRFRRAQLMAKQQGSYPRHVHRRYVCRYASLRILCNRTGDRNAASFLNEHNIAPRTNAHSLNLPEKDGMRDRLYARFLLPTNECAICVRFSALCRPLASILHSAAYTTGSSVTFVHQTPGCSDLLMGTSPPSPGAATQARDGPPATPMCDRPRMLASRSNPFAPAKLSCG